LFVLAKRGKTFARPRFNVGPGGHVLTPARVDYSLPFGASDQKAWEAEYQANISAEAERAGLSQFAEIGYGEAFGDYSVPDDWLGELEAMKPAERQYILDEKAGHPDLWKEGEETNEL